MSRLSECEKGYRRWISPSNPVNFGIEQMTAALKEAGWERKGGNIFRRPDGAHFRGPALAFHVLKGLPWPPK
jgi:hypothetical protein